MDKPSSPPPTPPEQLRLPFVEDEACPHCDTASTPEYDPKTHTFACPTCARTWTATTHEGRSR